MRIYEFICANRSALELLDRTGINLALVNHVEMYKEYKRMVQEGNKKTYVVQVLSDKYGLSERSIYKIVGKMDVEVAI